MSTAITYEKAELGLADVSVLKLALSPDQDMV
jgi:hypothetical protein